MATWLVIVIAFFSAVLGYIGGTFITAFASREQLKKMISVWENEEVNLDEKEDR